MIVIPAIDLLDGRAVRLHQGRYDEVTVYHDDPVAFARTLRGRAPWLHVVDLEGARDGNPVQRDLVREIVRAFEGQVQVGGGVRSRESFEEYLGLGVARVILGTKAVSDPEGVARLAADYPSKVVVAVDAHDGWIATDGWTETSKVRAVDLARTLASSPVAALLYTDIARDGTGRGPNVEATAALAASTTLPVIASGGVGSAAHLAALAPHAGIVAAIVGRALYDGSLTLEEAQRAAAPAGSP